MFAVKKLIAKTQTEKALRLKKRPFASKISAAAYFGPVDAHRFPFERARHTLQNLFMENGFIAGPWELGACPFRPPRCALARFAERRTTPPATSRHQLTSRAVFFLGISAAALSPDADRRRLPAPFLQAKFCDSLTDQSQSISVPLAQSRDHKQLSLSPYIARTNTRRHNKQCLAQSSRTSSLPP